MSGIEYPEAVREEFRKELRLALDQDARLDKFIDNFTATVCRDTPKLAAYRWRALHDRRAEEVRSLYEKHKDNPDGRWWPEIVAGCLSLDAAWEGRLPRGRDFEAIVARYLSVSEEVAEHMVSFSGCHDGGSVFHAHWLHLVSCSNGPRLKDIIEEAGL